MAVPAPPKPETTTAAVSPTPKAVPSPAPATQPEAAEKNPKAQNLARMDLDKMAPYTIQVGAFLNKSNADQVLSLLTQKGYAPFIFQVTDAQQRSFYMVRFGHFGSREEASKTLEVFKQKEKMAAVIVRSGMM
jgi:cell division septation protein DedD